MVESFIEKCGSFQVAAWLASPPLQHVIMKDSGQAGHLLKIFTLTQLYRQCRKNSFLYRPQVRSV
jgi:hypothetical protein